MLAVGVEHRHKGGLRGTDAGLERGSISEVARVPDHLDPRRRRRDKRAVLTAIINDKDIDVGEEPSKFGDNRCDRRTLVVRGDDDSDRLAEFFGGDLVESVRGATIGQPARFERGRDL